MSRLYLIHDGAGREIAEAEGLTNARGTAEFLLLEDGEDAPLYLTPANREPSPTDPHVELCDSSVSGVRWNLPQGAEL